MKIHSRFHDYYDNEAYVYGVDPNLLYLRYVTEQNIPYSAYADIPSIRMPHTDKYRYEYVSILGTVFLVAVSKGKVIVDKRGFPVKYMEDDYNVVHKSNTPFYERHLKEIDFEKKLPSWNRKTVKDQLLGVYSCTLMDIHKELNVPIFRYSNDPRELLIRIKNNVPMLQSMGIDKVIDSFTIYNKLQEFFSERLEEERKELDMTEKEKVLSKGFDPVVSFRHRKEKS